MSRIRSWADRDQQVKDGYNEILEDQGGSVDVYRNKHNTKAAGFDGEVKVPLLLRTIVARIDEAKDRNVQGQPQEIVQEAEFTALTEDTDVLTGDIWEYYDLAGNKRRLRVVKAKGTLAGNAVSLDEVKAHRR